MTWSESFLPTQREVDQLTSTKGQVVLAASRTQTHNNGAFFNKRKEVIQCLIV